MQCIDLSRASFCGQASIIYDEKRGIFAVHPKSKEWYLVTARDFEEEKIAPYSEGELEYQELFAFFCHKIAIKERKNLKLQRNMVVEVTEEQQDLIWIN